MCGAHISSPPLIIGMHGNGTSQGEPKMPSRTSIKPSATRSRSQTGASPRAADSAQPRHPGGRKVSARMPVLLQDGSVVRPRAKGSRAQQPPVKLGQITRSLPLVRSESDIPFRGIMSGSGRLVRLYKEAHAVCEEIWLFLEQMEQGLFEEGDRAEGLTRALRKPGAGTAPPRRATSRTRTRTVRTARQ
jgi:hypothetical protein